MIRLRHKLFVRAMRGLDPLLLFATLFLAAPLVERQPASRLFAIVLADVYRPLDGLGLTLLAAGWLFIFTLLVHYDTDRFTPLGSELREVVKATSAAALLLLVVATAFPFGWITNPVIILAWASSTLLLMVVRVGARAFLTTVRGSGYNYRHLLIVGHNQHARATAARIDGLPALGYKIVGFVEDDPYGTTGNGRFPVLGDLGQIQAILERHTVDEMMICLPLREQIGTVFELLRLAQELGIVARVMPDGASRTILPQFHLERFEGDYVVTFFRDRSLLQLFAKRVLDVMVSASLLILLAPLMALVALAIRLTSAGPVFFVQKRVGMNKRTFDLYKFRSMYVDAEQRRQELAHLNEMDGPVFKIRNDPRVTPIGRLIRKTSIDELPQLFNVLTGRMSLVGPRPPLHEEVDRYEWAYRKRLSIKPGITCLWQISGRNHVSFKQWMEMDRLYIERWSLWLDLKILAGTIPAVLTSRGAS